MATVVLLDPEASIPLQVDWALWLVRTRKGNLAMMLPQSGKARSPAVVAKQVETLVAQGDQFDVHAQPVADDLDSSPKCYLRFADVEAEGEVLAAVTKATPELFIVLLRKLDATDERIARLCREILPRISCAVAIVDLGDERWPIGNLMVAASRGAHPRAALKFARDLASDRQLTATYVEPDIGTDAQSVGRHVLDRVLHAALGDGAAKVNRNVVVAANVESGLQTACETVAPDAVVLAMPRPGVLFPKFFSLTPARLSKRVAMPVIILRESTPLGNRLRRGLEDLVHRRVPQAERETRVELASRVQSNSAWNFDFVALISLSTVIAALGLLQNSAAVIIGAMLIAPLMTPILGVGLAVAQGNAVLARMAFRSIAFGVGTSFVLAVLVGLVESCSDPITPTAEMWGRGWPGLSDLMIAFVSGLAAAYANSRPGLVAALPGVAIAAALVPPIATSGLAVAAGEFRLAYGSFLLFFANMVAIVLAAGFSLWAVGVRRQTTHVWLRHLGPAFVVLALALSIYLTQRTRPGVRPLDSEVQAVLSAGLPDGMRLLDVVGRRTADELVITVEVGGAVPPESALAGQLRDAVSNVVGEAVQLQLAYVWQTVAPAIPR